LLVGVEIRIPCVPVDPRIAPDMAEGEIRRHFQEGVGGGQIERRLVIPFDRLAQPVGRVIGGIEAVLAGTLDEGEQVASGLLRPFRGGDAGRKSAHRDLAFGHRRDRRLAGLDLALGGLFADDDLGRGGHGGEAEQQTGGKQAGKHLCS
jgi:hypothetical protein